MHNEVIDITTERRFLEGLGSKLFLGGLVLGIVGLGTALAVAFGSEDGMHRFWWSYLTAWVYFLTIGLGGLFFVLVEHLAKAGWSVVLRRLAEGVAATLLLAGVLFVPLLFGGIEELYHWTDVEAVAHDHVLEHKSPYLNLNFFLVRVVIYFGFWILASQLMLRYSRKQDASGEWTLTSKMEKLSAPFMFLFALTSTFAAFDFVMSLDAHWFSTIFGVYFFAGSIVSFLALLAIIVHSLQATGRLTKAITKEHTHDVGKFMFAMLVFWAYIAFSQFMLIWYGNLPEETGWYLRRQTGDWAWVGLALLFVHFLLPFLFLLSRGVKRRPLTLVFAALWLLAAHYLDLYWLIMPEYGHGSAGPAFGVMEVATLVGLGGLFVAAWSRMLGKGSLVPERDPRLEESLTFENV